MNFEKLSIVSLALLGRMCFGKIIVKTKEPNGFAGLEEAAITILTNCYENKEKTIVVFGDFPRSFLDKLSSRRAFSVVLLNDRRRAMDNTDYSRAAHRDTYHKVHIAVILMPEYTRFNVITDALKTTRYYETMAFILLIAWSPERRYAGCSGDLDTLDLVFNLNNFQLLNANVLCDHQEMGTVLYGFNSFASGPPKPWRSERHIEIPNRPNLYWFVRTYHENKDMCKNLHYKKFRDLAGLRIKVFHTCNKKVLCSREAMNAGLTNSRSRISVSKRVSYINDFMAYVNATTVEVYHTVSVGIEVFDGNAIIDRSFLMRALTESFFAYPHGTMCMQLVTQFRGNKSQIQKIIAVIDLYSWIGVGIVCFVTLLFFKYFLRQPLMDAILNIVRLSCNFGLTAEPRNLASRIYFACVLSFVVTLQGIFVSNLAALLRGGAIPSLPPIPGSVGIKNCKQLFWRILAFTAKRKVSSPALGMSAGDETFFSAANTNMRQKSCLQFLIPTVVFRLFLTQDSPARQVNSVQDLVDLGYTVFTPISFVVLFIDVLPKDRIVTLLNNEGCLQFVLNNSSNACLQADPTTADIATKYNVYISECVQMEYFTHILPHYWAFNDLFNNFLGVVTAGGILMPLHYIVDKRRLLEADAEESDPEPRDMALNDLLFAFIILGVGLVCALVTFVIEIMVHRYHHRVAY